MVMVFFVVGTIFMVMIVAEALFTMLVIMVFMIMVMALMAVVMVHGPHIVGSKD